MIMDQKNNNQKLSPIIIALLGALGAAVAPAVSFVNGY
jgi:hypothetical protein